MALRSRKLDRGRRTSCRGPRGRGVSAAVHESTKEEGGYMVIVFGGEEAFEPVLVRDFPGLIDLLAKLAPIIAAS
jgi:hypothetical protein